MDDMTDEPREQKPLIVSGTLIPPAMEWKDLCFQVFPLHRKAAQWTVLPHCYDIKPVEPAHEADLEQFSVVFARRPPTHRMPYASSADTPGARSV